MQRDNRTDGRIHQSVNKVSVLIKCSLLLCSVVDTSPKKIFSSIRPIILHYFLMNIINKY